MTNKEKTIIKYMTCLDISREEAEQLWIDDNANEPIKEVKEIENNIKKNSKRHYEKNITKTRKKTSYTRKEDTEKINLLISLHDFLINNNIDNSIVNKEREITFKLNDNDYSIVLIKHRIKK